MVRKTHAPVSNGKRECREITPARSANQEPSVASGGSRSTHSKRSRSRGRQRSKHTKRMKATRGRGRVRRGPGTLTQDSSARSSGHDISEYDEDYSATNQLSESSTDPEPEAPPHFAPCYDNDHKDYGDEDDVFVDVMQSEDEDEVDAELSPSGSECEEVEHKDALREEYQALVDAGLPILPEHAEFAAADNADGRRTGVVSDAQLGGVGDAGADADDGLEEQETFNYCPIGSHQMQDDDEEPSDTPDWCFLCEMCRNPAKYADSPRVPCIQRLFDQNYGNISPVPYVC